MTYFSCLSGSALLAFLAATSPPWAVDSPAAIGGGARFGIGLGYLVESQESLRIESQQIAGIESDPDLLNRKFDLEWEMDGPIAQVPVALSSSRLTEHIQVFPTLTLEAGSMDVTLDSVGKTEQGSDVALKGRGALFGAKLGATASLCESCPWFSEASYRYRRLPRFDVDRLPVFAEPGFEVLRQDTSLSQEVHEISTRVGYVAPNDRIAYYTGIRTRSTDVEIQDELRVVAGQQREMDLSTHTTLGSETVQMVAGIDTRLAGSLFANLEVAAGEGDEQVLLKMVFVPLRHSGHEAEEHRHEKIERFTAIASLLIPQLARILNQFRADWRALSVVEGPDGQPAYLAAEVDALLLRNETALLGLFGQYPELDPLADWVRDRFREARVELGLELAGAARSKSFQIVPAIARSHPSDSLARFAKMQPQTRHKSRTDQRLSATYEPLQRIVRNGKFWTEFWLDEDSSLERGVRIRLNPKYHSQGTRTLAPGDRDEFVYGEYSFTLVSNDGKDLYGCQAVTKVPDDPPCPLDLMGRLRVVLKCDNDPIICHSEEWREGQ